MMGDFLQRMLRDYQQRFRNSDEKSPDPEGCEHDGPIVTTSHMKAILLWMSLEIYYC